MRFSHVGYLVVGASVIFCIRGLNRRVPPFENEIESLQKSMSEQGLEPGTFCPVASALITRQEGGCGFHRNTQKSIRFFYGNKKTYCKNSCI